LVSKSLADQRIPFTVEGKTTSEEQMAAIRRAAAPNPVVQMTGSIRG